MRRRVVRLSRLSAGVILGVALAPWLGVAVAQAATSATPPDGYTVSINQGNVPTTAADYSSHGCDEFAGKDPTQDGWLFVASPDDFTKLQAVFSGGTVYWHDETQPDSAGVSFPKQFDHLAVVTPAGWTLQNAYAVLSGDAAFFTLSHTCAATEQPQPPTQPTAKPTVDISHSCDAGGFTVVLGNVAGTATAVFTVTSGGASTQYSVDAGKSQTVNVAVPEDTTGGVSVTAPGLAQTVSDTWARNCTPDETSGGDNTGGTTVQGTGGTTVGGTTTPTGAGAPTVDASNACATGISVELGDLNGTAPVTFTVTKPDGSTEAVDVRVGQIVKRSYPVADRTTGVVTVSAPGLDQQTFSYAKDCTQVLGEKVTKPVRGVRQTRGSRTPSTVVQGEKVSQLPFTGFPAGSALGLGGLLTGAGVVLTAASRRRYTPRHAAR